MTTPHPRRGFALIELLVALVILALIGVAAALVYRLTIGPVGWYVWPLSCLALPVLVFALGVVLDWLGINK